MKNLILILLLAGMVSPAWADGHRYLREKANPTHVLRSGYVQPGGLGAFDPAVYEEVEGSLPENAVEIKELSLVEKLEALFSQLPAAVRAQFLVQKAAVKLGLEQGDLEAVQVLIENTAVPDELAPVKGQMLKLLNP